jgi:glycosyltransferase involved in cell wall biosynthesis
VPELYGDGSRVDVSVVLPAFNEEEAVEGVVREVRESLRDWPGTWEILVVDDASEDSTAERAEALAVRVIRRAINGGSGAARKTGIRESRGELVAMLDTDGSYPATDLPKLLAFFPRFDQVNGARTTEQGGQRLLRVPAKWLIRKLAEWISAKRIPDLNTGMKVFKRDLMLNYLWAIPDGFSCVTSMTLAFLCDGHAVHFVPVSYRPRIGRSKFHPVHDTVQYVATVLRLILYFRPLRVFLPLAGLVLLIAIPNAIWGIFTSPSGLHDADVMLFGYAALTAVCGMLAELIVAQRRGQFEG